MTQVKFLIGDIKDLHKLDKDKPKSNVPKRNNDVSNLRDVPKKIINLDSSK